MSLSRRSLSHAARALWPWLSLPASLTAALRRAYGAPQWPRARVLGCGRTHARPEERRALGMKRSAWVYWREVELHGPDPQRPAIRARSSFPLRAIGQGLQPLTRHGSRPIGNTLFRHRRLRRSPIQIDVRPAFGHRRRWRRSSVLQRGPRRIWVEENLLPDLPAWRGRGR